MGTVRGLNALSGLEPDATNQLISKSLALVLRALYEVAPGVPWYSMTLYIALLAGLFWFARVVLLRVPATTAALCAPALLLCGFHASALLSLTSAMLLAELGAFLALAECVTRDASGPKSRRELAGILATLVSVCILRWELSIVFAVFALPIILAVDHNRLRPLWLALALMGAVVVFDRVLFGLVSTPGERSYLEWAELLRLLHDTPRGAYTPEHTPAALAAVGWTLEDYVGFNRWVTYDDQLLNNEKMRLFLDENYAQGRAFFREVTDRMQTSWTDSRRYTLATAWALLALLAVSLPGLARLPRGARLRPLAGIALAVGLLIALAGYRFMPRVWVPTFAFSVGLAALLFPPAPLRLRDASTRDRATSWAALLFALLGALYAVDQGVTLGRVLDQSASEKRDVFAALRTVAEQQGKRPLLVVLNPSDSLATQSVTPWKELNEFPAVTLVPAGVKVNTPRYRRMLARLGVADGRALLRSFIDDEQALFAAIVRSHTPRMVSTWESLYQRHISPDEPARFVVAYEVPGRSVDVVFFRVATGPADR